MGFFDSLFGKKARTPEFKKLELGSAPGKSFGEFLSQQSYFGQLSDFSSDLNKRYQESLLKTSPELLSNISQASKTTSDFLKGIIPEDVGEEIYRSAAAKSLAGGYGTASGMGRNLTARDLGLTSLNLMNLGFQRLPTELSMSQSLNPNQINQYLFSPSQILQRKDLETMANLNIANQQEMINAASSGKQGILGGVLGAVGGAVGGIFGGPIGAGLGMSAGSALGSGIGSAVSGAPQSDFGIGSLGGTLTGMATSGSFSSPTSWSFASMPNFNQYQPVNYSKTLFSPNQLKIGF